MSKRIVKSGRNGAKMIGDTVGITLGVVEVEVFPATERQADFTLANMKVTFTGPVTGAAGLRINESQYGENRPYLSKPGFTRKASADGRFPQRREDNVTFQPGVESYLLSVADELMDFLKAQGAEAEAEATEAS